MEIYAGTIRDILTKLGWEDRGKVFCFKEDGGNFISVDSVDFHRLEGRELMEVIIDAIREQRGL